MKVVVIQSVFATKRERKEVTSDLLWYDSANKKMLVLKGGKLKFSYDENGEMKVSTEPLTIVTNKYTTNYKDILGWVEANKKDFDLNILQGENGSVTLSFPDEMENDVAESLDFHRFDYEIL